MTSAAAWVRPTPDSAALRADLGLAAVLAVAALTTSLLYQRTGLYGEPAAPWLWALGLGLCTLPLALRRRYPVQVAVTVAAGFFVCGQFAVPEILIINICLFIALYTVGAWEGRRWFAHTAIVGITTAMLLWLVLSLIIASSDVDAYPGMSRSGLFSAYATFAVIQIITNLMYFGGAYFFGERSWRAARAQARLEAQGHELELERQTSATQAVALDRISIARELHDVVAHHVSVMGIQAAAARRSLARDPERATAALEVVEQSAAAAVDELRGLLNTLRTPANEGSATTVGIAQLPTLVAEAQATGVPTTLIVAGEPRPLPMLVDVALYRVVQEALTNVRKHAGRGARAEVRLRFARDSVEVEIGDDGTRQSLGGRPAAAAAAAAVPTAAAVAAAPAEGAGGAASVAGLPAAEAPAWSRSGSGLGLRGMRERIGAVGGTVTTSLRERGGFMVRATVPNCRVSGDAAQYADTVDTTTTAEGTTS